MSPVLKKLLAGFAATKAIEKIRDARRPQQSFLRRNVGKLLFVGLAGGATAYLFRSGKLQSVTGSTSNGYREEYPPGPGTEAISTTSDTRTLEPTGV